MERVGRCGLRGTGEPAGDYPGTDDHDRLPQSHLPGYDLHLQRGRLLAVGVEAVDLHIHRAGREYHR